MAPFKAAHARILLLVLLISMALTPSSTSPSTIPTVSPATSTAELFSSTATVVSTLKLLTILDQATYNVTSIDAEWIAPQIVLQPEYKARLDDGNTTTWSSSTTATFNSRIPGTRYNLTVTTRILKDSGLYIDEYVSVTSDAVPFYTKPATPGQLVQNVYQGTSSAQGPGRDVTLQFYASNGSVAFYTVTITQQDNHAMTDSKNVDPGVGDVVNVTFTDLTPDKSYDATITATSHPVTGPSETRTDTFRVEARPPDLSKREFVWPDGQQPSRTQTSMTVDVCTCLADDSEGQVTFCGLIVCADPDPEKCKPDSTTQQSDHYSNPNNMLTWKNFKKAGYKGKYRPTPPDWRTTLFALHSKRSVGPRFPRDASTNQTAKYTIGNESCDEVPDTEYCNGPLPPDTSLVVIAFACTSHGCSESSHVVKVDALSANDDFPVGGIVGGVVAVAVVIVAVIVILCGLRRRSSSRKPIRIASDKGKTTAEL